MLGLGSSLSHSSPMSSDIGIGIVTITGSTTPSMQTATSYSVSFSGSVTDATYSWSVSPSDNVVISNPSSASPDITFPFSNTAHTVSCQVSSATAPDSPKTGNLSVTTNTTNVVAYASDFSAGVNGWFTFATSNSAITGNVDAEGKTDLLQWAWSADEGDSTAYIRRTMDSTVSDQAGNGTVFALSGEVYYDDADDTGVGIITFSASLGTFNPATSIVLDGPNGWYSFYKTLSAGASTPVGDTLNIGIVNSGDIPTAGDKIYFKNIKLEYIDAS